MEQDIKILEKHLSFIKNFDNGSKYIPALENLIKAYKDLEEKNKKKSIEIICYQEELENSIPVSLVEEKIEKLKNEDLEIYDTDSEDLIIAKYEQRAILDFLQELLEKRYVKTMYKVKIVIDGLVKEITVNANSSVEVQNIITNMYGTGKVQIIDIRRV